MKKTYPEMSKVRVTSVNSRGHCHCPWQQTNLFIVGEQRLGGSFVKEGEEQLQPAVLSAGSTNRKQEFAKDSKEAPYVTNIANPGTKRELVGRQIAVYSIRPMVCRKKMWLMFSVSGGANVGWYRRGSIKTRRRILNQQQQLYYQILFPPPCGPHWEFLF